MNECGAGIPAGRSAAAPPAPPAVLLRPIAPRGLGEMRGLLHSRALLPLIPPPPFSHKGLKGGGFAGRLSTVSVPPNARADPSVS